METDVKRSPEVAGEGGPTDPARRSGRDGAAGISPARRGLALALVLSVLAAVHSPVLAIHPWGDDFENLYLATSIPQSPLQVLRHNYVFFRPVMLLLMYLNYLVSGAHPLGYNLVTLLFLLLNTLLVYLVARRLRAGPSAALAVAGLYGCSPLMSEATTWSGTRADQVMVALTLLVVLVAAGRRRPTSVGFQVLMGVLLVVAAATKESWIVLPVLLAATLLVARRERVDVTLRASLFGVLLATLYVVVFVLWPELSGSATPLDYSAEVNSPVNAILKLLRVVAWYAGFGHPAATPETAIAGALLLGAVVVGAAMSRRADVRLGVVLLVLALAPTLHFPVSPTRFNALPLAGFWLAAVGLADHLTRGRASRRWVAASLGLVLVVLQCVLLRVEIQDYRRFGELHRPLVQAFQELDAVLPAPGFVVLIDAGTVDGPASMVRSTRGMPKYVYPKPGGLWDLVYFHSLASFAGRPFEVRLRHVARDRVGSEILEDAVVLLFDDDGFRRCEGCRGGLLELVERGDPLPERTGVWSVIPVES